MSASPALRDRVAAGNGAALETNGAPAASLWSDAMKRVRRNRAAVASLIFLAVVALLATLAPWVPGLPDPTLQNLKLRGD